MSLFRWIFMPDGNVIITGTPLRLQPYYDAKKVQAVYDALQELMSRASDAGAELRVALYVPPEPTTKCPGKDCPMCNGETCERCGAAGCAHDVVERHQKARLHPAGSE